MDAWEGEGGGDRGGGWGWNVSIDIQRAWSGRRGGSGGGEGIAVLDAGEIDGSGGFLAGPTHVGAFDSEVVDGAH